MAPNPKLHRWLDLIAFLAGRRVPVAVDAIMEGVPEYAERRWSEDPSVQDALRRKFERDKDELRGLGIPIETVPQAVPRGAERVDGYRLARRDFYLPYLRLLRDAGPATTQGEEAGRDGILTFEVEEEEVAAAVEGLLRLRELPDFPLGREARSAYRKLTFDLDPARFTSAPVHFLAGPGAERLRAVTERLAEAVLRRKRVRFRYRGIRRGRSTDRTVDPYGLLFKLGRWYLVGHDHARRGIRVFRVSRMEDPRVETRRPRTPDFDVPDDFELAGYGGRKPWELAWDEEESVRARVLFRPPTSEWALRNGFGAVVERREDGSAVHELEVSDREAFVRWVLGLAGEGELLAPSDLRADVRRMARELLRAHREPARA